MSHNAKIKMEKVKQEMGAPEATPSESSQRSTQTFIKAHSMMMDMMNKMEELKEGMEELRQERPRKKADGNTESSFSLISK